VLKTQALKKKPVRTQWHEPIPQILAATQEAQVSAIQSMTEITAIRVVGGEPRNSDWRCSTMSPFKDRVQIKLLDARPWLEEYKGCRPISKWRKLVWEECLTEFESSGQCSKVKIHHSG
jgi:hypothetical protein